MSSTFTEETMVSAMLTSVLCDAYAPVPGDTHTSSWRCSCESWEMSTPVLEMFTPVLEMLTPVLEMFTPVLEMFTPILEMLTPVLEMFTPILEMLTPVLEMFTPVLEMFTTVLEMFTTVLEMFTPFCRDVHASLEEAHTGSGRFQQELWPLSPHWQMTHGITVSKPSMVMTSH